MTTRDTPELSSVLEPEAKTKSFWRRHGFGLAAIALGLIGVALQLFGPDLLPAPKPKAGGQLKEVANWIAQGHGSVRDLHIHRLELAAKIVGSLGLLSVLLSFFLKESAGRDGERKFADHLKVACGLCAAAIFWNYLLIALVVVVILAIASTFSF